MHIQVYTALVPLLQCAHFFPSIVPIVPFLLRYSAHNCTVMAQDAAQSADLFIGLSKGMIMELAEQLVDSWNIHNRILLYLMDAIPQEALSGVSSSGGRSVGQMLAHMHNVRLMWLEVSAPDLMTGLSKIPAKKKDDFTKEQLREALESSHQAMETLFKKGFEAGKIKEAKPHPASFYSYFIAHEWYHVGEIGMTLTQAGFPLEDKVAYGIWEWAKR